MMITSTEEFSSLMLHGVLISIEFTESCDQSILNGGMPCMGSQRVGDCLPVVGFLLVSFIK